MPKDRRADRHKSRPHLADSGGAGLRPCEVCGRFVGYSGKGRERSYCSDACRQRAYRERRR